MAAAAHETNARLADGEGVWSWCPDAGIKPLGDEPEGDGG